MRYRLFGPALAQMNLIIYLEHTCLECFDNEHVIITEKRHR